jgi:chemotaxis protein MotB
MQENEGADGTSREQPIIIKKVRRHEGHHGGAWKVAYADFVTAMMALFMVLWLMNSKEEEKKAVAAYFADPQGFGEKWGSGQVGPAKDMSVSKDELQGLAESIESAMKNLPKIEELKEQVALTVTGEGLRIELLETDAGMFFETGSAAPSESGREILKLITEQLAKLPNKIVIEGHTDARPFRGLKDYSNWELSVDRANAARRILLGTGLGPDRVVQVRGFADMYLRSPEEPEAPSNRRISLIVKYDFKDGQAAGSDSSSPPPADHAPEPAGH